LKTLAGAVELGWNKGIAVFAPKVAKPQTKTAESSPSRLAPHRSTLLGHSRDAVEQALSLQRTIGNQATLRLLARRGSARPENGRNSEKQEIPTEAAPRRVWWDSSKIPLFPPEQASRAQPLSVRSAQPGLMQPKLVIGPVNDPLEREADAVADRVMRMSDPALSISTVPEEISRKCAACEAQDRKRLQMKPAGTADTANHEAPPISLVTASPVLQAQPTNAGQIDTKWYGLITAYFDGPIGLANYAPDNMRIFSPSFDAIGTVITDASVPTADYELGFMQAVIVSNLTAVYVGSDGLPSQTYQITLSKLPVRDAADGGSKPWYSQKDVKSLDDGYKVSTDDQPRYTVPWQTQDKQGSLSYSSGVDYFSTWLVARHKSMGTLKFLYWVAWSVDWGCSFDFATRTGTKTGVGGQVTGQGDGQGPFTPLTDDPVANDVITKTWGGPP
jgi:hypothetical protein